MMLAFSTPVFFFTGPLAVTIGWAMLFGASIKYFHRNRGAQRWLMLIGGGIQIIATPGLAVVSLIDLYPSQATEAVLAACLLFSRIAAMLYAVGLIWAVVHFGRHRRQISRGASA